MGTTGAELFGQHELEGGTATSLSFPFLAGLIARRQHWIAARPRGLLVRRGDRMEF